MPASEQRTLHRIRVVFLHWVFDETRPRGEGMDGMREGESPASGKGHELLPEDRSALLAFRGGERWALAAVFRAYVPLVRTIVRHGFSGFRGFSNPADQDDMVQTIFAEAFDQRSRMRYDGLKPYSAFLRGMAHNKIRQRLSKDTRFARTDGAPEPSNPSRQTPEEALLEHEQRQIMANFRASITDPVESTVLNQYFIAGIAEESIAKELGITRYRVRKVIAHLHQRMVKRMRECDVLLK